MGVKSIVNKTLIIKNNLDPNQYTLSLLKEGLRAGFVNKQEIDSIQGQIMFILKDLISRYTQGESTSVTVETAEKILISVLYCIDAFISGFNPEDGIALLQREKTKKIYEQGVKLVTSCVKETKILYQEIKRNKLNIPLESYISTIDAMPDFFKNYGVVFNAHDTMADMDYPLVFDNMKMKGIFYIKQYLDKLDIETRFCLQFNQNEIAKVLNNFGRIYKIDYKKTLTNIFEVVINNSIFSVLLSNSADNLTISKLQYELLIVKFKNIGSSEINTLVGAAIEKIIINLSLEEPQMIEYLHRYQTVLMPIILNALEQGDLFYIIITDSEESQDGRIIFKDGSKMNDDSFRLVIGQIIACFNTIDKINIIKSRIGSLEDFIDILQADCLFGEEFGDVFSTLSDQELAILGRIVFAEELRNSPISISLQIIGGKETEIEWQLQYLRFIKTFSRGRIEIIEKLINTVTFV